MKKLLIIHESMGGGGAERVLVTLLKKLDPDKYDITLLLISSEGPFYNAIPKHVKVFSLFKNDKSLSSRIVNHFKPIRDYFRGKLARHLLGSNKFDVTISFMEGPAAKLHSQLLNCSPRNYSWVHCNLKKSHWYDQWFSQTEEKEFYSKVDKIAFVSREVMDVFNQLYETEAKKEVVYNPVETDLIISDVSERNLERDEVFTIVNVGRLVWQKNQSLLIDIAEILRDHGRKFRILIVGDGVLRTELTEQIKTRKLENEVRLMGFKNNPFPILRNADVFCLTSVSEGWGMVVVEALASSLPVISTPIKAVEEILADGGGIITDGTVNHFVHVIEGLMDTQEELNQMSLIAPSVAEKFDVSHVMKSVTDFIDN